MGGLLWGGGVNVDKIIEQRRLEKKTDLEKNVCQCVTQTTIPSCYFMEKGA